MGWIVYQIAMAAGLLAAAPFLLARRGRHYLETLPGRLGRHPEADGARGGLWIHAVSVGEVGVAATLARSLPESLPLLVTTVTPTGQRRAREAFASRGAVTTYLPFDFGFALRRFYDRFAPAALVLVEGDYWPLAMRFAGERELPVAVVNARVSRRSFGRLRLWKRRLPATSGAAHPGLKPYVSGEGFGRAREEAASAPWCRGGLWIHAVSVGEVGVAATLARSLPESLPLVVTTVTPTGQRRAREAFAGRRAGAKAPAFSERSPTKD